MVRLGAHMSIAGGLPRAIERGVSIGCDAIQIFLKNNMQWTGRPLANEEAYQFRSQQSESSIGLVFAHSCYLINLAAPVERLRARSVAALTDEVRRADLLGVPFIVMHPGAHTSGDETAGLRRVARSLDEVLAATSDSRVKIALETTAGQGTCLGHRFEHLAGIIQLVGDASRLAVCVDTCHIFAAGYDIRTARAYEKTMTQLDRIIGRERVIAFHLNDSKTPLNSRVDRHEHIGKGHLGLAAFRCVLRDPRWDGLPMVLETPKSADLHEDVENLRVLRRLL
jgi:deoxyribonuclease IV